MGTKTKVNFLKCVKNLETNHSKIDVNRLKHKNKKTELVAIMTVLNMSEDRKIRQ